MNIFIIHYTPLKDRKNIIERQLYAHQLNAEFITIYDRETLTEYELQPFANNTINNAEISYFYKQLYCYEEIITNNFNLSLILDDDAILDKNFTEKMNSYLKQLPPNWDICYLSDICNFHIPEIITANKTPNVFLKSNEHEVLNNVLAHGSTRGPAYLINYNAALNILNRFNYYKDNQIKISKAHDHWLNDVFRELNFNVYWAEPTIVKGGSEIGIYKTSLH